MYAIFRVAMSCQRDAERDVFIGRSHFLTEPGPVKRIRWVYACGLCRAPTLGHVTNGISFQVLREGGRDGGIQLLRSACIDTKKMYWPLAT